MGQDDKNRNQNKMKLGQIFLELRVKELEQPSVCGVTPVTFAVVCGAGVGLIPNIGKPVEATP